MVLKEKKKKKKKSLHKKVNARTRRNRDDPNLSVLSRHARAARRPRRLALAPAASHPPRAAGEAHPLCTAAAAITGIQEQRVAAPPARISAVASLEDASWPARGCCRTGLLAEYVDDDHVGDTTRPQTAALPLDRQDERQVMLKQVREEPVAVDVGAS